MFIRFLSYLLIYVWVFPDPVCPYAKTVVDMPFFKSSIISGPIWSNTWFYSLFSSKIWSKAYLLFTFDFLCN